MGRRLKFSRVCCAFALNLACVSMVSAQAELDRIWEMHYAEHLPEYCKYTQRLPDWHPGKGSEPGIKGAYGHPLSVGKYARTFGDAWHHMHHYCQALELTYQIPLVTNPAQRKSMIRDAINEYKYVLDRAGTPFVLHAEALFGIGVANLQLKEYVEAVEFLTSAIEIDPEYVPAYIVLAGHFERFGDLEQAASIVRNGLEHVPESQSLKEKLVALDSRLSADGH